MAVKPFWQLFAHQPIPTVEWLKAQKASKPDTPYSVLADMLNVAGVPTLRGLEKWSRGVVRSLISEEE